MRRLFRAVLLISSLPAAVLAQPAPPPDDLTRELLEILDTPVSVATRSNLSREQAPSIVSVITRADLETYGARDLSDVLKLVPGFQFGLDISAAAGLGFRGMWVHEGKALIMINGITANELGFGNFSAFQAVPASMIEKVEIIRGPGSALYGGFAEMTVINILTRRADGSAKGRASLGAEALGSTTAYTGGFDMNGTLSDHSSLAVSLGLMNGPTAIGDYRDHFGHTLSLDRANANRTWEHALIEAKVKNITLTYLHTLSMRLGQTGFDALEPPNAYGLNVERNRTAFDALRVASAFKPLQRLDLEVVAEYATGTPLNTAQYASALRGNRQGPGANISKGKGEVMAVYRFTDRAQLTAGAGFIRDAARNVLKDGGPGLRGEIPGSMVYDRSTTDRFLYAQYLQQFDQLGLTLGARQENTTYGSAFAPRLGLTYVEGAFNAKFLAGKAFRIPTTWQTFRFDNPTLLKPETAQSYEVEVGYKFTPNIILKGNLFHIAVDNPVVGLVNFNNYMNVGKAVTSGFEASLDARFTRWGAFANVSTNKPSSDTSQDFLDQDKSSFLAFAKVSASLGGYLTMSQLTLGGTLVYLGPRAVQSEVSARNQLAVTDQTFFHGTREEEAVALVDLTATWRQALPGLDLALSVHNLTDQAYALGQPYYGAQAPFPVYGKRVSLTATWKF